MKKVLLALLKGTGLLVLLLTLVYTIWQPVLPSSFLIQGMAGRVSGGNLAEGEEKVVRFNLSGKGGGVYNLVARKDGAEVIEGTEVDKVDLVLFMEATDFNNMVFSLARGKGDETMFMRMVIAKVMRFAGDMSVFELLFETEEAGG
jgi:hypothetical protein